MNFDQLANLLESTKGQIRAFDNKAQVLLGVNGVLIGFVTAEISKAAEYGAAGLHKRFVLICFCLGASFLAACLSMGYALFVINPQLHLSQPKSKFFFCHLASDYGHDFARAAADLIAMTETDALMDLGTQIQSNAIVADTKSARCKYGMRLAGVAVLIYAFSVPIFCSMAYSATMRTASLPVQAQSPCPQTTKH